MADTPQTLALIALGQRLRGDTVRTINRRSAALRLLKVVPGDGKAIAWNAQGDGQLAENYAEGADAANFGSDEQAQALLNWARVRSNFHVTGSAQRAAKSNMAGPDGMKDLIGHNIVDSSAKVASTINTQLFSGTGSSNQLTGFDAAIGDDTNTYAAIDRSTETHWRPTVVDPGSSTALTFAQIRSDLGSIYDACGMVPDLAFCKTNVFNTLANLFSDNRRYVQQINTARGHVVLDAGFEGIEVDGCVFVKDKDATANRIYYVNSSVVELQYQAPDPAMLSMLGLTMASDDGYGALPLGIRCEKLAKSGDADKYMCFVECNLVVKRPNACGVRKNVAVS